MPNLDEGAHPPKPPPRGTNMSCRQTPTDPDDSPTIADVPTDGAQRASIWHQRTTSLACLVNDGIDEARRRKNATNNSTERSQKVGDAFVLLGKLYHDRRNVVDEEDT